MSTPPPDPPRQLAVVDIDGVLADVRHRLGHLDKRPKDWGAFFRGAAQDPPLAEGIDAARRLAEVYEVVYLSGRPEHLRKDTLAWFRRHGVPEGELHLRPRSDFRPAREFKVAVLRRLNDRSPVALLVDDDSLVLEAARAAGFDVLPATWMGAAPELHEAQEQEGRT
jgi:phosphoglycolate phosphatase-like HAD superfamily hydrolase